MSELNLIMTLFPSVETTTMVGGCEWRSEVFVKVQKKKIYIFFLGGGGGRVWGVRVDGNGELKLL